MHAYGRTLLRAGDLRLLALPGEDGHERYCVADGFEPVGAFRTLEQAVAAFEAVCAATAAAARRRELAARGIADPTASRRRRRQR